MKLTINPEKIQELKEIDDDGSNDTLKQLIELFLNSTPQKLINMQNFLQGQDLSSLRKEAHSLRSSALTMGADELAELTTQIEYSKDETIVSESVSACVREFEAIKKLLSELPIN